MKILNVDFNTDVVWNEEIALNILSKANPDRTEKELKTLIKASKLVKDGVPKNATKSGKRKTDAPSTDWNADNIQ